MIDRATAGLGLWVRSEWRRGWRSLLGLALLIAFGGGVTPAAIGVARRADSAFDRILDHVSSPVDVSAAGIESDLEVVNGAWADLTGPIAGIPGVRGVTPVSWTAVSVLGASFALDPSRDRSRVVAVSAIGGLPPAIGGAVAVALVKQSTTDVLRTPSAFCADWDLELTAPPDNPDSVIAAVTAEPGVDAFALQVTVTGHQFVITGPGGTGLVSPQSYQDITGSTGPFIERGDTSVAADDVVLGEAIARTIDAGIGDSVTVAADDRVSRSTS